MYAAGAFVICNDKREEVLKAAGRPAPRAPLGAQNWTTTPIHVLCARQRRQVDFHRIKGAAVRFCVVDAQDVHSSQTHHLAKMISRRTSK